MIQLTLMLTLNDPHDALPDPNWHLQRLQKHFVCSWDSNLENLNDCQHAS